MNLPIEVIYHILSFHRQSIVNRSGKIMNRIASDDKRYEMLDEFRWKIHLNSIRLKKYNIFPYQLSLYPQLHYEEILWNETYFAWLFSQKIPKIIYYEVEFNYDSLVLYLQDENVNLL